VRRSGDRVRIQAQLVETSSASTLWSQSFERSLSDVFAVQDEIGKAVVEALAVRLLPGRSSARAGGTTNPEALQYFLRGRDLLRRGGRELPKAWEAFEKAVAADPRFALAWVGIAGAIVSLESTLGDLEGDPAARRRRAREAADRAVALAPDSPDAYRTRADVHQWLESDWSGQLVDLERALALAPGDPGIAISHGFALQASGDLDGAIAEFERATRIDPLFEAGWLNGWLGLGVAQMSRGDQAAAIASLRRALELFPSYCEPRWGIGMSFIATGQPGEALAEAGRIRNACLDQYYALGLEALAHHDLGHPVEARAALDQVVRDYGNKGAEYQVGELHAWRGEADLAFEWLEKARAKRDTAMFWLKTDPLLRKIRGDQRWPVLVERAGLPPDGAVKGAAGPVGPPPLPAPPSIAVLPFADMSPKHDQEYFADGVAEEILDGFAQVDGLRVIGRTSSFSFKGKDARLGDIGRELGVSTVLEGSVRRSGQRVRIAVRLVRVADGSQLWSKTYDRSMADVFGVQAEISRAVVGELKVRLLPGASLARTGGTTDGEALQQFLVGRQLLRSGGVEEAKRAQQALERAVARDPGFAQAWAALSFAIAMVENLGGVGTSEVRRARTLDAAERAVKLAPRLADGYAARGNYRLTSQNDWRGARADFERAVELEPGSADSRIALASSLAIDGDVSRALREAEHATRIDPLLTPAWEVLGDIRLNSGDVPGAIAALGRARELNPGSDLARLRFIQALVVAGRPGDALAEARKDSAYPLRYFGEALALHDLGRVQESRAALEEFTRLHAEDGAYQIAEVHAWKGDLDRAFEWLDRAWVQKDGGIVDVKGDPLLRKARGDPRYAALLRKMKLAVD
jgi:TolB-like protein/tetratricopeptide (TPR) repeat protein